MESVMTTWNATNEICLLEKLRVKNPKAYEEYKRTFYIRTRWGTIDRHRVAVSLGLERPKAAADLEVAVQAAAE